MLSKRSASKLEKFSPDSHTLKDLILCQPESGYRYTTDALVLAAYANLSGASRIIEAGCGCGVISLILARQHPDIQICAIEIQEELAAHARRNASFNHLSRQIRVLCRDLKRISPDDIGGPADLLISNPPYKKRGSGRLNPDRQKAVARHEVMLDIDQLFTSACRLLTGDGKICLIFPSERLSDIERAAACRGFGIASVRSVHTRSDLPPGRVIVHAERNRREPRSIVSPVCF